MIVGCFVGSVVVRLVGAGLGFLDGCFVGILSTEPPSVGNPG